MSEVDRPTISAEEAQAVLTSVISELLWPTTARHKHPVDILTHWIMAFPKKDQGFATRVALGTAVRMISVLTLALMQKTGDRVLSKPDKLWVGRYLMQLNQRVVMNRAVDKNV